MKERKLRRLDMGAIKKKQGIFISTEESLKDVVPIKWSNEVVYSDKKVLVSILK